MRWLIAALILVVVLSSVALAQSPARPGSYISTPFIAYAATGYNPQGNISTLTGINWLLGFTHRWYLGQGLRANSFTFFFSAGTFVLVLPYFEFGVTYAFAIDNARKLITIDFGLLYFIGPYISFGIIF